MYKAYVFDLDGTVADTIETIAYYVNITLEKYGLKTFPVEDYKYFVGEGAPLLIERVLKAQDKFEEALHKEMLDSYLKSYNTKPLYLTSLYDGMEKTLKTLKEKGMKLGVFSNKPQSSVDLVVDAFFEKDFFDVVLGQQEGNPRKPDPTMLLKILDGFGVSPNECVYVGDTATDMQTGKNADCFTVGVLWGFRDKKELEENKADLIISSPKELEIILKNKE